jgi:hypothetical protein
MKTRALVLTLLLLTGAPTGADERVGVRVSPSVAFAPADLSVRATVEADEDNRQVEIVAESADFYRSSQIQLDGNQAPRTTYVSFRSLPGGRYSIRVVVRGSRGQVLGFTEKFATIVGREGE